MSVVKLWNQTFNQIQENLETLLARPVFLEDIFVPNFKKWHGHVSCQERGRPCEPFEFLYEGRPTQSCHPGVSLGEPVTLNPNLQPLKLSKRVVIDGAYDARASRKESKVIAPLKKGNFYLMHGWDWTVWNSNRENRHPGALVIVYILTDIEKKSYEKTHSANKPIPREEIIAISWAAFWQNPIGYSKRYQPNSRLDITPNIYASRVSRSKDEFDFMRKYMQGVPLTSSNIPYPSLNNPKIIFK